MALGALCERFRQTTVAGMGSWMANSVSSVNYSINGAELTMKKMLTELLTGGDIAVKTSLE
jgi:hypothetical protein